MNTTIEDRLDLLERRCAVLERRMAQLQRELAELKSRPPKVVPSVPNYFKPEPGCARCGLTFSGSMGYVCSRFDCPNAVVCGTAAPR